MNTYENAEPNPLKFLVSNGNLVDEDGNVIAHSDDLKDMYDKATPHAKKYLLSDGSVVDENGTLIIKNDYFKKVYEQSNPKVAKYLHSDGTVDENPGGADLEDNHQTTIDVSAYTDPVEVTPTQGKDGMKKVTVSLSNIPSGGSVTAYAWTQEMGFGPSFTVYLSTDTAPVDNADFLVKCAKQGECVGANANFTVSDFAGGHDGYTRNSDSSFSVTYINGKETSTDTYTRDPDNDFTLW